MAQPTVNGVITGLVVLGSIRKQAERSHEEQDSSSILHSLYISCCVQAPAMREFLSWIPLVVGCYVEA